MPICETLSLISTVVIAAWATSGPGSKQLRWLVAGALLVGLLLCWGLVYFGHLSEPASSILVQLAIVDSVAMLLLPVAYRKLVKHDGAA